MKSLGAKTILKHIRSHPALTVTTVLLILLSSVAMVLVPLSAGQVVTALTERESLSAPVMYLVGSALVTIFLQTVAAMSQTLLAEKLELNLKNSLSHRMLHSEYTAVADLRDGDIATHLSSDLVAIKQAAVTGPARMLGLLVSSVSVVIALCGFHWKFPVLAIGLFLGCAIILSVISRKFKSITAQRQQALANHIQGSSTMMSRARLLRTENTQAAEQHRLVASANNVYQAAMRHVSWSAFSGAASGLLLHGSVGIVGLIVLHDISRGELVIGDLVAIITLLFMLSNPFIGSASLLSSWFAALASFDRIGPILNLADEPTRLPAGYHARHTPSSPERPGLSLAGVTVGTPDGKTLLNNISFAANSGTVTTVCGPSGSGKSTLFAALLGLTSLQGGTVTVTGSEPLMSRQQLRDAVGLYQPIQTPRFDTVSEALSYGLPTTTDAAKIAALQQVGLADRATQLLTTPCAGLSTGEWARVCLARAALDPRRVLLIDEPTSNLDAKTEQICIALLLNLARSGKAVIIASHSAAARQAADQVVDLTADVSRPATQLPAIAVPNSRPERQLLTA